VLVVLAAKETEGVEDDAEEGGKPGDVGPVDAAEGVVALRLVALAEVALELGEEDNDDDDDDDDDDEPKRRLVMLNPADLRCRRVVLPSPLPFPGGALAFSRSLSFS
jgi:hypothetical protein